MRQHNISQQYYKNILIITQKAHNCGGKCKNCVFLNLLGRTCATKKIFIINSKKISFLIQIYNITCIGNTLHKLETNFDVLKKVVILAGFYSTHEIFQKWGKIGGGAILHTIWPPHTIFQTKNTWANSSLQMFRKLFEVFPEKFLLSQKNYLHTFMYTFLGIWNFCIFFYFFIAKFSLF